MLLCLYFFLLFIMRYIILMYLAFLFSCFIHFSLSPFVLSWIILFFSFLIFLISLYHFFYYLHLSWSDRVYKTLTNALDNLIQWLYWSRRKINLYKIVLGQLNAKESLLSNVIFIRIIFTIYLRNSIHSSIWLKYVSTSFK